jgi:hypothetical protein
MGLLTTVFFLVPVTEADTLQVEKPHRPKSLDCLPSAQCPASQHLSCMMASELDTDLPDLTLD